MSDTPDRQAFEELHYLLAASLSGEITENQNERLQTIVCEDAALRKVYLGYLTDTAALRWWAGEQPSHRTASAGWKAAVADIGRDLLHWLRGSFTQRSLMWLLFGAMASLVEVAVLVFVLLPSVSPENDHHSQSAQLAAESSTEQDSSDVEAVAEVQVARMVRMVNCRWLNDSAPAAAGVITAGSDLWLASGFAELKFNSGARVVLQGPVWLTPTTENAGQLHQGKLTARVPQVATGFTIKTPTGEVVDLGTEFGVQVFESGETVLHVFTGRVEARPTVETGELKGPTLLVSGQTACMTREVVRLVGPAEVGAGAGGGEFLRWLPGQGRFPLFATGRGLEEGQVDPHWEIVHEAGTWEFQPARVIRPNGVWMPNDHYSSQWISLADGEAALPAGRHVFRTRFSLAGYKADKARIIGRWMADNSVEEIRLNGRVVSSGPVESGFGEFKQFEITAGFVPDENIVEFVVNNDGNGGSPMGLRVEWYGMAEAKKPPAVDEASSKKGDDRQ